MYNNFEEPGNNIKTDGKTGNYPMVNSDNSIIPQEDNGAGPVDKPTGNISPASLVGTNGFVQNTFLSNLKIYSFISLIIL